LRRDSDCLKIFSKRVISEKLLKKSQLNAIDREGELERLRRDSDCLKIFSKRVISEKLLKKSQLNAIDREVATLIDSAVEEGFAAPFPAESELLTDVYSNY
jgi:TPP-dependent pyruvate/acetoin dehydrogenase alpha subunit